jgi:predicted nucleic acid-binding protein
MPSAIFDNTVFNIAARIQSCDLIGLASNLFQYMLVPQEIYEEMQRFPLGYEPEADRKIQNYIKQIKPFKTGLQLCTTYDPVVFAILKTKQGVDKGEAEAIAQAERRGVFLFFTDDQRCADALQAHYTHIRFVSTLHLISLLDIMQLIVDYKIVLQEYFAYKPLPRQVSSRKKMLAKFRKEYEDALSYFSLPIDKKLISQKTSPKKLGI